MAMVNLHLLTGTFGFFLLGFKGNLSQQDKYYIFLRYFSGASLANGHATRFSLARRVGAQTARWGAAMPAAGEGFAPSSATTAGIPRLGAQGLAPKRSRQGSRWHHAFVLRKNNIQHDPVLALLGAFWAPKKERQWTMPSRYVRICLLYSLLVVG